MNRKLLILDCVLAAVLIYAGFQFRRQWQGTKAREAARLHVHVPAAPPPPFTPLAEQPPVLASGYASIADKMLFTPSRNPNVVIEVPPPPPPKPVPPLPVYHGMMNFGEGGPIAILSVSAGAPHEAVRPGEMIGQFKLVSVNSEEIVLEWDGKEIHKAVDEIATRMISEDDQPAARSAAAPAAAAAPAPVRSGPGEDTGRGFKTCDMRDTTPDGAVVGGFRKVTYPTPFGQACRWETVR